VWLVGTVVQLSTLTECIVSSCTTEYLAAKYGENPTRNPSETGDCLRTPLIPHSNTSYPAATAKPIGRKQRVSPMPVVPEERFAVPQSRF
jgi:hypothetical protein